jgi:hypothetical protein
MSLKVVLVPVLLLFACAWQSSNAAVIIGDIAGNSFSSGYSVGPGGGINNAIAEGFTMGSQSYNLTSVDLYLDQYVSGSAPLYLSIFNDVGGKPGTTDLYDLSTNVTGTTSGTPTVATFTGSGSYQLNANTKYWLDLYANPATGTGSVTWVLSSPGTFAGVGATDVGQLRSIGGGNSFTNSSLETSSRTAFQLNGNAVTSASAPEPASLAIWGLGALGCAVVGYRRRKMA